MLVPPSRHRDIHAIPSLVPSVCQCQLHSDSSTGHRNLTKLHNVSSALSEMKGLLFVSSGDVINGSLVAGYVATQGGEASLNGLTLASHASLQTAKLQEGSFLGICSVASVEATHSDALVKLLYNLLQPGGTLSIQQAAQVRDKP